MRPRTDREERRQPAAPGPGNGADPPRFPDVPFLGMDTLWFQVSGTICNLRCTHCLISCAPDNHSLGMLTLEDVTARLEEAVRLGVKDYYFTGGEPFMNREIFAILAATLEAGPATVLSNGLLLDDARARRLRELSDGSSYSLDVRISLDGYDPEAHDAIRGAGTWERALGGARCLLAAGLNPVLTVTEVDDRVACPDARTAFLARMRALGFEHPRLKVLSLFRTGREQQRTRGYARRETLEGVTLDRADQEALQCSSSRVVTTRGVWVCPILIEDEAARMGEALAETLLPYPLAHRACFTCHATGATCRT